MIFVGGSPKAPVWVLCGLDFLTLIKESKKVVRVCLAIREYTWVLGGVLSNKITFPQWAAFQHQFSPAVPEGTVADFRQIRGFIA